MQTMLIRNGTNKRSQLSATTSSTSKMKNLIGKLKESSSNITLFDLQKVIQFFRTHVTAATAETITWVAIILIHASIVPTMIALMAGLSDKTPPIDLVLFIWGGLSLLFIRAAILKDMLNVITIGCGFLAHAIMLALVLFK